MTQVERFFAVLENKPLDKTPYFPEIQSWYDAKRRPPDSKQRYIWGVLIPDDSPIHSFRGDMPEKYQDWSFLDFYRNYNWGLPLFFGGWNRKTYTGGVKYISIEKDSGKKIIELYSTPKGELSRELGMSKGGSLSPRSAFIKNLSDFKLWQYIACHTEYQQDYENAEVLLENIKKSGVADLAVVSLTVGRSPFGSLIHDLLGLEQTVFMLMDHKEEVMEYLSYQEELNLRQIKLAAACPFARIVFHCDHPDQNIISPPYYRDFCIPYYQKMCSILKQGGKFISTHYDGNHKGFFPYVKQTGFDFLDACTPKPMNNYTVEELAEAISPEMKATCGIPSALFSQDVDDEVIISYTNRIVDAFNGRVIVTIGDSLGQNGNIHQVVKAGKVLEGI